ncbi:MAG: monovalent cation/H+ antiporter complex subunit F [Vicinamibacterales bacterium]|nr:monovalent cation/H+ antiporter complex subunit F [Vicinamibacterales bacterium]
MMQTAFLVLALAVLGLTLPYLWRVSAGPTVYDRVLALNAIGSMSPVVLVLIGLWYERLDMFVDLALALFLLNVFTTLLVARYARPPRAGGRP